MTELKVFQIGLGSFGRYGFERLVELSNHFEQVDVELKGVCDRDFEKLEAAEKFASANGLEIETFVKYRKMYEEAEKYENVLIYDSGAANTHAQHIYDSLQRNFFHLAEQPPSMTREEHMKERKLEETHPVFWKADMIERESPVVKKAARILQDEKIDEIKLFRQSSAGIQKLLNPHGREEIQGGDILDQMVKDVFVLDLLEEDQKEGIEVEEASSKYLMPKSLSSSDLMTVRGNKTGEIGEEVATAETEAVMDLGVKLELKTGWLGVNEETLEVAERIKADTGFEMVDERFSQEKGNAYLDQECRFFTVKGSRNLVGDLLHNRLIDLDSGEEIETPRLMHDQLYRVLRNTILEVAGEKERDEIKTEGFMETIFDIREQVLKDREPVMDEVEAARDRIRTMTVEEPVESGKEVEA